MAKIQSLVRSVDRLWSSVFDRVKTWFKDLEHAGGVGEALDFCLTGSCHVRVSYC